MLLFKELRTLYFLILVLAATPAFAIDCVPSSFPSQVQNLFQPTRYVSAKNGKRLRELERTLSQLTVDGAAAKGPGIKVMMGAIEVGQVPGLRTLAGNPLNISAGGVSTVMNDIAKHYPPLLKSQKNGSLTIVSVLMDGVSTEGMTFMKHVSVPIEGGHWKVGLYRYKSPDGADYIFLENDSFKRFTATPGKGENVYTMRGISDWNTKNLREQQRIWSAINQATARVFKDEGANLFLPHDSHFSPASFYISKQKNTLQPISLKPLVHNEKYLGNYPASGENREAARRIWNLKPEDMNRYFMHGDDLYMTAPAVRVAEQRELFTGYSVAEGTAKGINGVDPRGRIGTNIDFFGRMGELTNGLGKENRPHLSRLLQKGGTKEEILAEGISHPEVIAQFQAKGFGGPGQGPKEILAAKAEAKAALQKNFGLEVDPNKPLFVSFARMVEQKGMEFVASNIEYILKKGGQVIVGGPVDLKDAFAVRERMLFIRLKERIKNKPYAKNFHFIDGAVMGRSKGLSLAGGDFFMIPSRYEPCGLTDCEALYHGMVPIAHNVGGLNKGRATILYSAHPDDQGWQLGQALDRAFKDYSDAPKFKETQLKAMQEDFSLEKNFDRFLVNNRVEVYGKMIEEANALVRDGKVTATQAQAELKSIFAQHREDLPELVSALRQIHPDRRTPMMNWVLRTYW